MEKFINVWLQDQHQCQVLLSLMLIQDKAKNLYDDLKKKYREESEGISFNGSHGQFHQFKARANFHDVKASDEAVSADTVATQEFPKMLQEIIDEGANLPKQDFNVDEIGLYQKRIPG